MKKIPGLFILILVFTLSAGLSNQQVGSVKASSCISVSRTNQLLNRPVEFQLVFHFEENLLGAEEEDETVKPFILPLTFVCYVSDIMEIYQIHRTFHRPQQELILFESDSSPPPFLS